MQESRDKIRSGVLVGMDTLLKDPGLVRNALKAGRSHDREAACFWPLARSKSRTTFIPVADALKYVAIGSDLWRQSLEEETFARMEPNFEWRRLTAVSVHADSLDGSEFLKPLALVMNSFTPV